MTSKEKQVDAIPDSANNSNAQAPVPPPKGPPVPTTSKNPFPVVIEATPPEPAPKRCWKAFITYLYDPSKHLFCGRTCASWWYIIIYSIMYLIFLSTYTMLFLYGSLMIIRTMEIYQVVDKTVFMAFTDNGIGLTATPTSVDSIPLISYAYGQSDDYNKYIKALDELLVRRRKRQVSNLTDLGPCGAAPYGFGTAPCVIIRPNKQLRWSAKPMKLNSAKEFPEELKGWLKLKEQKLWLYCSGYHSYDKEHIGSLKYYPYPPGYDPNVFPLDMRSDAPLIAVQISNFTLGLSLTVECKLYYDNGVSSVAFLLYVEPKNRSLQYRNST